MMQTTFGEAMLSVPLAPIERCIRELGFRFEEVQRIEIKPYELTVRVLHDGIPMSGTYRIVRGDK